MSQTEMPSQCAGILKFQHLKNFMFGVTTASNFASLRDILQPHPSGYLNTLRGITVNLNMNHAQRIMRLNLNNAETWDVSNVTESEEDTLGTNLRFNVIVGASGITWHLNGIHLETLQINPGNVHFCMSLNFEDSEGNFSIDPLLSYAGPGGILNRKAGCALCREPWYDQLDLCSCGDIYCSEHGGTCINCEFQGCAICIASHACNSQWIMYGRVMYSSVTTSMCWWWSHHLVFAVNIGVTLMINWFCTVCKRRKPQITRRHVLTVKKPLR